MNPKTHILIGGAISLILLFVFDISPTNTILFFLSSFLLDFDHYIYAVYKTKSYNPKKAYLFFINKSKFLKKIPKENWRKYYSGVYVFHGVETIIFFILLGILISKIFFYISAGIFLHLLLDWAEKIFENKYYPHKFSIFFDIRKIKKKKEISTLF